MRKDAKFRAYLPPRPAAGGPQIRPQPCPPLGIFADPNLPWQGCSGFVAGQIRTLEYKEFSGPVLAQSHPNPALALDPHQSRPAIGCAKGSKLLYREPAFLITTDLTTPAAELIAANLARWEVEVNFRDEKTLLGVGQAQVRNPRAVARAPAFLVACYAMLLWSNILVFADHRTADFDKLPRWPARATRRSP